MSINALHFKHVKRFDRLRIFCIAIFYLAVLVLWEVLARAGRLQSDFFPPPSRIFVSFLAIVQTGQWRLCFSATLARFMIVFVPGAVLGACCGWLFGLNRLLKSFAAPLLAALYFTPKLWLLLPLFIFIGKSWLLNVLPPFFLVFVTVAGSTLLGTEEIDPCYFDIGRNYGLKRFAIFKKIVVPATLPHTYRYLQVLVLLCIHMIVLFEVIMRSHTGLGHIIWQGWKASDYESVWAGLLSVLMLAAIVSIPLKLFRKTLMPWKQ